MKGTCRHYNGTLGGRNSCCDAGINYRELAGGEDRGWLNRIPCIGSMRDRPGVVPCDKMDPQTPEEIKARRDEIIAAMDRVMKTGPLVDYLKKTYKGKNTDGKAKCPICAGVLHWKIAGAYNGHVAMRCETEGCINFTE